ncbi:MAG TPA: glycosyltransferase family 39 protein [Blastocatellia bacterium]|nr:glycosyltransferase family 39 protein [Blastocatellia bacterium]
MEPISPAKHRAFAITLLIALCFVLFFAGLGSIGFIGPDEPRYAEVAREMFASGDYITPRLCGCLWFEKPPLLYWLAATAYHVAGVGEFAARSASALSALLSVVVIFLSLKRVTSLVAATASSLVLATSLLYIGYARACATDMPLAAMVSVALMAFFLSAADDRSRQLRYWLIGCAATGGAVLAKGLVGVVLVGGALAATWLITRRRLVPAPGTFLLGLVVFLAVASVWYVPMTIEHGQPFIKEFFVNHHFRRFVENRFQHPEPVYFFPFVVLAGALPWTFFLIPAAARLRKVVRRRPESQDLLITLSWVWLILTVVFFSVSVSKLPGYVLPAFPALAIILGTEVERLWNGERSRSLMIAAWLTAASLIAIGIAVPVYITREALEVSGAAALLVWLPLAAAVFGAVLLAWRRFRLFVITPAAVTMFMIVAALRVILPQIDGEISSRSLSRTAAESLRPGEKIAFYIAREYGPVFYSEGRVACGLRGEDVLNAYDPADLLKALEAESSLVVILRPEFSEDLEGNPRLASERIAKTGRYVIIRIAIRPG